MKYLSLGALVLFFIFSTESLFAQDPQLQTQESRTSSTINQPSNIQRTAPTKPGTNPSQQIQPWGSLDPKKAGNVSRPGLSNTNIQVMPDLIALRLTLSKGKVLSGEAVTARVMVNNNSSDAFNNIPLAFLLDGKQIGKKNIDLAAHATKLVSFRYVARDLGIHTFSVRLDPENSLDERNEHNNETASPFTVVQRTSIPTQTGTQLVEVKKKRPDATHLTPSIRKVGESDVPALSKHEQDSKPMVPQGGGAWGFDFSCSLPLQQGAHRVDPNNPFVLVKVQNNGIQNVSAFYVGLGKKGIAKIGKNSTWLSVFQVVSGGIPSGKWMYAQLKLPPGINETMELVAAVDINAEIVENDETNNVTEPFRIAYNEPEKPSLPSQTADLMVFPELSNATYCGDGKEISVMVKNNGLADAPPCTIGIGLSDQVKKGGYIKWAGKATVPKIFSQQHVYVTIPGQFQVLPADSLYTVAVDINDDIDEQGGENNNFSKSFIYKLASGIKATLPPQGNPFEAFDIKQPKPGDHLQGGSELTISWNPNQVLNNLSPEEKSRHWEIDIALVDPVTNKVVVMLAKNAKNRPVNNLHTWRVTLPAIVGDYRIRLSSPLGSGWGQSGIFSLYKGKLAQAKLSTSEKGKELQVITSQKMEKVELSPAEVDAKALVFKSWKIKSITPKTVVLKGSLGSYARLTSINVVVEYESNKPFRLTSSLNPPDMLKPDAVWSLAVPTVSVEGCLADANEIGYQDRSYLHNGCRAVDPVTYQYPWKTHFKIGSGNKVLKYPQGILPQGKNTITLVLEEAGVAHGLEIVGKAEKLVDYQKGVIIKHKWVYAKCTRKFYPYFNVELDLRTYRGKNDSVLENTQMAYSFKVPPVWQRLDPWENDYFDQHQTATGIPVYNKGNCTFE